MKKIEYYENEKVKSKKFISNISNSLKEINPKIEELGKSKKKTDNLIEKFDIECFKYNLVNEMNLSKNKLEKNIQNVLKTLKLLNVKSNEELDISIKKVNYINDILDNSETQLKNINKEEFDNVEKLQMNAIKKGIYDKFMLIKSEIDRDRIKNQFDKIQNKNVLGKVLDKFFLRSEQVDMKKENLFMLIHEIDETRDNILRNKEPKKEYKILEILADIELFIMDNEYDYKYRNQILEIKKIRENINNTFTIDKHKFKKELLEKQQSKFPIEISKKMSKIRKERQKAVAFLTKNGYIKNEEDMHITSRMGNIIAKLNIISKNMEKILRI